MSFWEAVARCQAALDNNDELEAAWWVGEAARLLDEHEARQIARGLRELEVFSAVQSRTWE